MSNGADLLDASAILAVLGNERGSEAIEHLVPGGRISSVNLAEVLKKLMDRGVPKPIALEVIKALDLDVLPFTNMEAIHSTDFIHPGVSLGDRACLGTAQLGGYRVITAESKWVPIRRDVEVWLFR